MLLLPVSVGLFMISADVIQLVAGDKYINAGESLRILSIATIFSLYAYTFVNCVMIPKKKETVVFYATLASALINVILNFILIPIWGLNAAAFTTVIAEAIICLVAMVFSREFVNLSNNRRNIASVVLGCLCIVGVCYISKSIHLYTVRLFVEIVFSAMAYFLVLFILKNSVLVDYYNEFKIKIRGMVSKSKQ